MTSDADIGGLSWY